MEIECQRTFRLRMIHRKRFPERSNHPAVQRVIFGTVLAKRIQRLCKQTGRIGIIGRRNQIRIRRTGIIPGLCIKPEPVAVLVAGVPEKFLIALRTDIFHPFHHHRQVLAKHLPVAIGKINLPRANHRRIRPCGTAAELIPCPAGYVWKRHGIGNRAVAALLGCHIPQPFAEKAFDIKIKGSRADKYLRVAGPAQPFVALRAIGRNIEKIVLLAPDNILIQPIEQRAGGDHLPGAPQLGVNHNGSEARKIRFVGERIEPDVAEAHKRVVRFVSLVAFTADVSQLRFCGTQIFSVEIAGRVQHFRVRDHDFVVGVRTDRKRNIARNLLPEIDNRFSLRGVNQSHWFKPLVFRNRLTFLRNQDILRNLRNSAGLPVLFNRTRIIGFSVINIAETNLAFRAFPRGIGRNHAAGAAFLRQHQRGNQPDILRDRLISSARNSARKPTLADSDDQFIFILQQMGHVVFLHLHAMRITCPAWRQYIFADALAIQICFINAEGSNQELCLPDWFLRRKASAKCGTNVFHRYRGINPLSFLNHVVNHSFPPDAIFAAAPAYRNYSFSDRMKFKLTALKLFSIVLN